MKPRAALSFLASGVARVERLRRMYGWWILMGPDGVGSPSLTGF